MWDERLISDTSIKEYDEDGKVAHVYIEDDGMRRSQIIRVSDLQQPDLAKVKEYLVSRLTDAAHVYSDPQKAKKMYESTIWYIRDLSYWRDVIEVITFAFIASYLGRADDRKAALDWLWKDRSSTLDELISAGDEKAMSSGAAAWLKCISAECYTTTIGGKVTYVVVDSADFIESVFSSAMKDSDLQDEMKAAARHAKEGLDTTAE